MGFSVNVLRGCCFSICVLLSLSASASEEHSLYTRWLPDEFSAMRLREGEQSLTNWHVKNEATAALGFVGTMGATYVLSKTLPSWLPAKTFFTGAGIAIDSLTASDITDFAARQAIRAITLGAEFYYSNTLNNSRLWFALSQLLPELPNLIQGSREWWKQKQPSHQGLEQSFLLGESEFGSFELQVTTTPVPSLVFSANYYSSPSSASSRTKKAKSTPLFSSVTNLMATNKLRKLVIRPVYSPNKPLSLDIDALQKGNHRHVSLALTSLTEGHQWSSSLLTANTPSHGDRPVYIPLSRCVVEDINRSLVQSQHETLTIESACSDLLSITSGTQSLQMIPLDEQSYLLADHGISQSIQAPDLWLGNHQHPDNQKLNWLESQLIPGGERGLWRLVSSARALAYQLSAHYLISKIAAQDSREPEPASTQEKEKVAATTKTTPKIIPKENLEPDPKNAEREPKKIASDKTKLASPACSPQKEKGKPLTTKHKRFAWNDLGYPACWEEKYQNIPKTESDIAKVKGKVIAIVSNIQHESQKLSHEIVNAAFDPDRTFPRIKKPEGGGVKLRGHTAEGVKLVEIIEYANGKEQFDSSQIAWLNRSNKIISIDHAFTLPQMGLPHTKYIPRAVKRFWKPEKKLLKIAEQYGFKAAQKPTLPLFTTLSCETPVLDSIPKSQYDFQEFMFKKPSYSWNKYLHKQVRDFIFGK